MALTSSGDVYVLGDNSFGQHGKEELPSNPVGPSSNLQGSPQDKLFESGVYRS